MEPIAVPFPFSRCGLCRGVFIAGRSPDGSPGPDLVSAARMHGFESAIRQNTCQEDIVGALVVARAERQRHAT